MSNSSVDQQQSASVSSNSPNHQEDAILMHTDSNDAQQQVPHALELRCLLDNNSVGGIIGKGGASVRAVREDSGAFVSIVKADVRHVQERIMILKGSVEQIATAAKGIALLLIDTASRREERPVEAAQIRLLVHKSGVGAVIGREGSTIKQIQSETGARVQVSNETLPQSSEKTITVTANAPQMYNAMLKIAQQLHQNPLKAGTKVYPYVPGNQQVFAHAPYGQGNFQQNGHMFQHPNHNGAPMQAFGNMMRTNAAPSPALMSTQKIAIPTICAGSVIGKGGSVIRDLRLQSGTTISIADPDESTPNERVVTLSGTPQAIQTAVFLIRQLVESYQPNQPTQNAATPTQQQPQPF